MKKFLSIACVLAATTSMMACGGKQSGQKRSTPINGNQQTADDFQQGVADDVSLKAIFDDVLYKSKDNINLGMLNDKDGKLLANAAADTLMDKIEALEIQLENLPEQKKVLAYIRIGFKGADKIDSFKLEHKDLISVSQLTSKLINVAVEKDAENKDAISNFGATEKSKFYTYLQCVEDCKKIVVLIRQKDLENKNIADLGFVTQMQADKTQKIVWSAGARSRVDFQTIAEWKPVVKDEITGDSLEQKPATMENCIANPFIIGCDEAPGVTAEIMADAWKNYCAEENKLAIENDDNVDNCKQYAAKLEEDSTINPEIPGTTGAGGSGTTPTTPAAPTGAGEDDDTTQTTDPTGTTPATTTPATTTPAGTTPTTTTPTGTTPAGTAATTTPATTTPTGTTPAATVPTGTAANRACIPKKNSSGQVINGCTVKPTSTTPAATTPAATTPAAGASTGLLSTPVPQGTAVPTDTGPRTGAPINASTSTNRGVN